MSPPRSTLGVLEAQLRAKLERSASCEVASEGDKALFGSAPAKWEADSVRRFEGGGAKAEAAAQAASAATGEIITTAMFYPIELVKSRLQAAMLNDAGGSFAYNGLFDGLRCIACEEGPTGLFNGLPMVATRATVMEIALVYMSEWLLSRYKQLTGSAAGPAMALPLRTLGGCLSILFTLPLETLSTRVTTARPPVGAATAARQLYREGGIKAFWKGLRVTFILCLNPALMFTTVEVMKAMFLSLQRRLNQGQDKELANGHVGDEDEEHLAWGPALALGAVSKTLTMCLVYPLIRGKVLLQARHSENAGFLQVLRQSVELEGWRSLYKGLSAQLSKSVLSASLKYAVKERIERRFQVAFGAVPPSPPPSSESEDEGAAARDGRRA